MRLAPWLVGSLFAFAVGLPPASAHADEPPSPGAASAITGLPWLGVSMDKGGDVGVRIENVLRGSPAERSGLRTGDRIVAIDGARVTSPALVSQTVAQHRVGDTVTLGLERGGSPIRVPVVLAVRPTSDELVRMALVGAPAPPFRNVTPLSGAPASLAALKGKVTLIDFWATWCGPCRMIAPRLSSLKDRLGPQGLAVVGITTDPAEQAAVFAERHHMRYPVIVDNEGETSRAYNVTGLPTMVLLDKSGVVRDVFVGFDPDAEARLEAAIRKLLPERSGPPPVPAPSVPRPEGR
jgi:thiol-disulfide isomerase/thioredoxin